MRRSYAEALDASLRRAVKSVVRRVPAINRLLAERDDLRIRVRRAIELVGSMKSSSPDDVPGGSGLASAVSGAAGTPGPAEPRSIESGSPPYADLDVLVTEENFDEHRYLQWNPDVAQVVRAGLFASGRDHFQGFGRHERRRMRSDADITTLRQAKMQKLRPFLRDDMPHTWRGEKVDYLSEVLRKETAIVDTANVSSNTYSEEIVQLFTSCADGLVLDCGAGRRDRYYGNVVNYEIVDYESTDVLGVGEQLPFKDESFDGVVSIAVLEHVRDPFRCAAEIVRVLKPGGKLICAVPFLQPLHGYPHHYYNMTHQGLRALFERSLHVDKHVVVDVQLPVFALTWIVRSWASGLPAQVREQFLNMPLRAFMGDAQELVDRSFVRSLSSEKNFELACGTLLFASKAV
jgi:SAM-dependent methyltransferase